MRGEESAGKRHVHEASDTLYGLKALERFRLLFMAKVGILNIPDETYTVGS